MNCRHLVCIPVYNNPETIAGVIEACLHETDLPILVVDDGSFKTVEELFLEKQPEGNPRVSFLRHPVNLGKGVALQSGFKYAIDAGYTHLLAIDGDGQHAPSDIPPLLQGSLQSPWALIVGDRDMQTENVPGSSTFGKKFSNFWVRYQTDVGVADSQSGFRIYPLFFLQNMKFFCKKYDFEIEVLIRLIWKGIEIKNVRVSVRYFPKEIRVSHFHKWKDNFRISVLNTFLTVGSLLREQSSPFKSALAVGIGVLVGTTPLYGLHTGIAALLALIFRFNFIYLWLGTNISLPPFLPFLVLASKTIGTKVLGPQGTSVWNFGAEWAVGSVVLGTGLGLLAFALMYSFKQAALTRKTPKAWTGRNHNTAGIMFVRFILKAFGLRFAYFFLYFIVFYYYAFSFRTRKSFTEYWRIVRPEMGFFHRQLKIYQQILVFAKTLVDRGLQREHKGSFFEYELDPSVAGFTQHLESPKGIVSVASHIGGWELAMTFFAQLPTEKKMLAVMHGIPGQYGHESNTDKKSKSEVVFFNLEENTILKLKDYLAAGQVIGMMADRPVSNSHEMLPFFGKLALFDTTPFRIAIACRSELYFIFAVKIGRVKYKIFTFHPNTPRGLDKNQILAEVLRQYVTCLENILRQHPEQWFNFFPFWSERA